MCVCVCDRFTPYRIYIYIYSLHSCRRSRRVGELEVEYKAVSGWGLSARAPVWEMENWKMQYGRPKRISSILVHIYLVFYIYIVCDGWCVLLSYMPFTSSKTRAQVHTFARYTRGAKLKIYMVAICAQLSKVCYCFPSLYGPRWTSSTVSSTVSLQPTIRSVARHTVLPHSHSLNTHK